MTGKSAISTRGRLLDPKSFLCQAGIVYALALAVRLLFLAQAGDNPLLRIPVVDERVNWGMAERILDNGFAPIPYLRAPGYLYVLAGLAGLLHRDPFNVRLAQISMDALSPVLMLLIGVRCFGRAAGLIAGLLGALFWTCVFFSSQLMDTSLICLLCLALTYLLVRAPDDRWWKWLGAGILAGVATVVRPNLMVFAPILAGVLLASRWLRNRSRTPTGSSTTQPSSMRIGRIGPAVLLVLGCAIAVLPVSLRNRIAGGDWVIVCATGGVNLWMGNNPEADGREPALVLNQDLEPIHETDESEPWEWDLTYQLATRYADQVLGPGWRWPQFDGLFSGMALDYIKTHPRKFAGDVLKRFCWVFNAYEFPNNKDLYDFRGFSPVLRVLSYLHFGVVCPFALLGIVLATRRGNAGGLGLICYMTLLVSLIAAGVLFVVNARYRLPIVCLLLPFAGYGLSETWRTLYRFRASPVRGACVGGCLVAFVVFCNANLFGYRPERRPAYLQFIFATACHACNDVERLPAAMAGLGEAFAAEAETFNRRRSLAALIAHYYHPFTFLMNYYSARREWPEAIRYGNLMLAHEPLEASSAKAYFTMAMSTRRRDLAWQSLQELAPRLWDADRSLLGDFYMHFGRYYRDPRGWARAIEIFAELARENPSELRHHQRLAEARKALATWAAATRSTRPSAMTTPATTRHTAR